MKKAIIFFALVFLLSCQMQPQAKGFLQGKINIGPLCPVERNPPDPRCQPTAETFQAWPIAVFLGHDKVAMIIPKTDGTFNLPLAPGTYTVDHEKQQHFGKGTLPSTVEIKSGETTTLDIDIDTGIR
jgi:hypothetical protein